ncbi:hypothetical protein HAX54_052715, partial [Datura stramonium]|nr:hypothetical protein [Datura stramonium]
TDKLPISGTKGKAIQHLRTAQNACLTRQTKHGYAPAIACLTLPACMPDTTCLTLPDTACLTLPSCIPDTACSTLPATTSMPDLPATASMPAYHSQPATTTLAQPHGT